MHYVIIVDGVVTNVIWLDPRNASDFTAAIPIGEILAGIGDTYADGAFWRDGVRLLTPQEQAEATIAALDAAVLDLEYTNAMMALGL